MKSFGGTGFPACALKNFSEPGPASRLPSGGWLLIIIRRRGHRRPDIAGRRRSTVNITIRSRRGTIAISGRRWTIGRRRWLLIVTLRRLIVGWRINRTAIGLSTYTAHRGAQQPADGRPLPGVAGTGGGPQARLRRRPDPHPSACRILLRHGGSAPRQENSRLSSSPTRSCRPTFLKRRFILFTT
jgi:hypothetical protein